jgi:hypothetical protein
MTCRLNFLGDLFVNECSLFSQQLPFASGSRSDDGSATSVQFIHVPWQQQQADGRVKQLTAGHEVRWNALMRTNTSVGTINARPLTPLMP